MNSARGQLEAAVHHATGVIGSLAEPGDRVATCLPNTVRSFATSWAMTLAGVVEVPVPPDAAAAEAAHLLTDAAPSALLLEADAPAVRRAALALDLPVHHGTTARPAEPDSDAPRTRAMAYTSGTTGVRKGVHAGVHDGSWGRAWLDDERSAFDHRHGDRHLVVSPLYHSGPFRHALACADAGGIVQVLPRFDLDLWIAALRRFRPTSMFCVPTHLQRLLTRPDLRPDDLASLRLLAHAGAPCPVGLKRRVHELAPRGSVWEFYGSTEGQFTVCPPELWAEAPGTVGRARHDREVTVRDRDGAPAAPGTTGTVWTTAPAHGRWEYWADPEATSAAWDGDRFTVDDLGHFGESGLLTLDGRAGDLVISGGVNVHPAEVEAVLRELDGVADAVVFGIDDPDYGQRVVAAVIADHAGPPPSPQQLVAACRQRLSAVRVPKQVVVVEDFPRTATGKILRADLPALLV